MTQDPYAALGLSKNATADEIKKAYRSDPTIMMSDITFGR